MVKLLPEARRSYYLDVEDEENGFFLGHTNVSDEVMDQTRCAHAGIPVYTTDAAGYAGGGWSGLERFAKGYPPPLCTPHKSSNFREFHTGVDGFEIFQERLG